MTAETKRKAFFGSIAPLFVVSFFVVTAMYAAGCPKGAYHDTVVAEHDFTTALRAFQQSEMAEFQSGRISAAEHQTLEAGIGKVAAAEQVLVASLQASPSSTGANATIQQNFSAIITAVSDLLNNGVLGIKNPTSQATLKGALLVAQTILTNASQLLSNAASPAAKS